eukprot:Awhi_evm1s8291
MFPDCEGKKKGKKSKMLLIHTSSLEGVALVVAPKTISRNNSKKPQRTMAQLAKASAYEAGDCGFESRWRLKLRWFARV